MEVTRGAIPDWAAYGDGYGAGAYGDGYGACGAYGAYGAGAYGAGDVAYGAYYYGLYLRAAGEWTKTQRVRLAAANVAAGCLAFWKSDRTGLPCNGGSSTALAAPGARQSTGGPLALCGIGTLHATMRPDDWKGERLWVVALYGDVVTDGTRKFGALEREIIGEVKI